jgi:hypothetical protein
MLSNHAIEQTKRRGLSLDGFQSANALFQEEPILPQRIEYR